MRPQQQGRRSRNRGGGRRNQNPLQRSYESNGPDVKIRGNAQVIADKYATLARDALSSGDTVMAENYLQHAEHYNRIILAAQPQPRENEDDQEQPDRANGRTDNARPEGARADNGRADEGDENAQGARRPRDDRQRTNGTPADQSVAEQPSVGDEQPVIEGTPAEVQAEQDETVADSPKPRRARQRRPRKKAGEEEAAPAEATADETATNPEDTQEAPIAAE